MHDVRPEIYIKERGEIFLMNKEIGMMLPKKANTSGVGESNNYYEDIYNIHPYSNTH